VVLVVNLASACGFTPQYTELQALHSKYSSKGLAVIGFPCNQVRRLRRGRDGLVWLVWLAGSCVADGEQADESGG
jgi:glutathione peroxidase-family protein